MLSFDFYNAALPYDDFFAKFGKPTDKPRWENTRQKVVLTDDQKKLLGQFKRKMNVLVLAGAWCGDCANQCPIFEVFARAAPAVVPRYLDRDAHPAAQQELQINGGNRVPVAVFFSEDGQEVSRYGERTLTAYRKMAAQLGGDTCGSGIASGDTLPGVVQNWLDEFERAQHMLRLSPRLRRLHGD